MTDELEGKAEPGTDAPSTVPIPAPGAPAVPAPQPPANSPVAASPTSPTSSAIDFATKAAIDSILSSIETERNSRAIVYWVTDAARMAEAVVPALYDQLSAIGQQERLDLVLFTRGGDSEIPIRIVSLIREFCNRFAVLIPYRAYSAGTSVAMGADEIVMTKLGVLGPIDPSRSHPLLPRPNSAKESEPVSVQDMRHAMQFIREAAGQGETPAYTPEAWAQIFTALFDKIHPLAIGAIEQSYTLAKLVGRNCLRTHMDPVADKDQINKIVDRLCDDYKSHAYQLGRREAKEIGLKVVSATASLESELMKLLRIYSDRPLWPSVTPSISGSLIGHIAWLDSRSLHLRVEGTYSVSSGERKIVSDRWAAY